MTFLFFCTPFFTSSILIAGEDGINIDDGNVPIATPSGFLPSISQYLVVSITASNTGSVEYPTGTAAVKWIEVKAGLEQSDIEQQRFKIYIDDNNHDYYISMGQNRNWSAYIQDIELVNTENTGSPVELSIVLPVIEGIDIKVNSIELKDRIAFPVDTYIGQKILDFSGDNTRTIIPVFIPVYLFMIMFFILAGIFYFMFRKSLRKIGISAGGVFKRSSFVFILVMLLGFSVNFIYIETVILRSYWDSYKSYILKGDLEQTYMGFYDFEKFIKWVDGVIPEGENLIIYVRGEPVYTMSEMAYNLYPRDIKFINISNRTYGEITSEIESINEGSDNSYDYVVILSEDDADSAFRFALISRYRVTGGFIYQID